MINVDPERCETLTAEIGEALKRHYRDGETDQRKVYEALQSLAAMSATVIGAAPGELLDWFLSALSQEVENVGAAEKRSAMQ